MVARNFKEKEAFYGNFYKNNKMYGRWLDLPGSVQAQSPGLRAQSTACNDPANYSIIACYNHSHELLIDVIQAKNHFYITKDLFTFCSRIVPPDPPEYSGLGGVGTLGIVRLAFTVRKKASLTNF